MHTRVGIIGGSGYSGMEATRLLASHPRVRLQFVTSDRWVGDSVAKRTGAANVEESLRYAPQDKAETLAEECDVMMLATPAEASLALAPKLLQRGVRVIDFSGAFRLENATTYAEWYGHAHTAPSALGDAVYGMPELFRSAIAKTRFVANPGCYATALTLALAPLHRSGWLAGRDVVVNAASGVSGAGRRSGEDYSFCEIDGDYRAYRVFRHQHTPEVEQTLRRLAADTQPTLTFTPHLLPVKRGILCTMFARLPDAVSAEAVRGAFESAYATAPFVRLSAKVEEVTLKSVVGTNALHLAFEVSGGRLILLAAIDNLVKGAAGQAIQNLNVMMGWPETDGLTAARGFHP